MVTATQGKTSISLRGRLYQKHEQHWYEDGNFGFLVEDTAFLLHRSVLSKRSAFMTDLFGLPQSTRPGSNNESSESITLGDGTPFVNLDVSCRDFANTLNLVYPTQPDATSAQVKEDSLNAPFLLLGIVQVANKYLFDDIKLWTYSQLKDILIPDLETTGLKKALENGPYSNPRNCIKIIEASRECDLPELLPLAFYALATTEWETGPNAVKDPLCLQQLSDDDQRRIHHGRLALIQFVIQEAHGRHENGCTTQRCPNGIRECRHGLASQIWMDPAERWTQLMLHPLEELEFRLGEDYGGCLCQSCGVEVKKKTREFEASLVSRLGALFCL